MTPQEIIQSIIAQWGNESIELIKIKGSDFYELTNNFKEFTYELLMISNKEDDEEIKRLLDFYNDFINIKKDIKNSSDQVNISIMLSNSVLSSEVKDLLYYVTYERNWINIYRASNEEYDIKTYTEEELRCKINKLYEEFESGIIHYNKKIKQIIKFLEK